MLLFAALRLGGPVSGTRMIVRGVPLSARVTLLLFQQALTLRRTIYVDRGSR